MGEGDPGEWDLSPPEPSTLGDREVPRTGSHLEGRRVALLVTGGIAAMKAPLVSRALRREGAEVVAFATEEALRYVGEDALHWSTGHPVVTRLSPLAEHLSDDDPFDAFLLAPATYNTINKLALGIADNVVLAPLAGALGRLSRGACAVLVAPTMHGSMHNPILTESLLKLRRLGVRLIPPRPGYGKHNIPDEPVLVAEVARALSRSVLRGRRVQLLPPPASGEGWESRVQPEKEALVEALRRELWMRGAATGDGGEIVVGWPPLPDGASFELPGPARPGDAVAGAKAVADALEALHSG